MYRLNTSVEDIAPRQAEGEVGIEIEVEGEDLPQHLKWYWHTIEEHSLRNGGREYVLKKPVPRQDVAKVLMHLQRGFGNNKAIPDFTQRTSVHIHINVQSMTLYGAIKYAVLYYIFEDVLTANFKKERQGNNFCLRLKDAMGTVLMLQKALKEGYLPILNQENWKYGALNLSTLFKFGSLEFRAMEGNLDSPRIGRWVDVLLAIKDASLRYETIEEIISAFSFKGVEGFITDVFTLKDGRDLSAFITSQDDYISNILDGLWRIQSLGYIAEDAAKANDAERMVAPAPVPIARQIIREDGFRDVLIALGVEQL